MTGHGLQLLSHVITRKCSIEIGCFLTTYTFVHRRAPSQLGRSRRSLGGSKTPRNPPVHAKHDPNSDFDCISGAIANILYWGVKVPLRSVLAAGTIARVRLGDGTTRVVAGERVRCSHEDDNMAASPRMLRWREWPDGVLGGGLLEGENKRPLPDVRSSISSSHSIRRPTNSGRDCFSVECRMNHDGRTARRSVEERHINLSGAADMVDWEESVVVLEEGLALPSRVVLELVNTVYAVLVLRGDTFHYLHNDFAMSAEEEESLVEWGIGRRAFAGILFAVGGLMLVLFSDVWRPAVVGTLLVAAATYRIEGALTTLIRICYGGWKDEYRLIPKGIHGTERFVQFVLITTLAVSEILDHRLLLLIGLSLATFQVVILEIVGQIAITWGLKKYLKAVFTQFFSCAMAIAGWMVLAWVGYFGGRFASVVVFVLILVGCVFVVVRSARSCIAGVLKKLIDSKLLSYGAVFLLWLGMSVNIVVDDVSLTKHGYDDLLVSVTPWKWRLLTHAPDGIWSGMRFVVLWLIALGDVLFTAFVSISMFSFKIGSDRGINVFGVKGERSMRRKERGEFMGFREYAIPSRHLFHDIAVEGCDTAV